MCQKNDNYRISFAKTGTSFNDESRIGRGKQQLIYCSNPSKKALGMKIWVKANTNVVKKLLDDLTAEFQLQDSENISISKKKDLVLEYGIFTEVQQRYPELMQYIISNINK